MATSFEFANKACQARRLRCSFVHTGAKTVAKLNINKQKKTRMHNSNTISGCIHPTRVVPEGTESDPRVPIIAMTMTMSHSMKMYSNRCWTSGPAGMSDGVMTPVKKNENLDMC